MASADPFARSIGQGPGPSWSVGRRFCRHRLALASAGFLGLIGALGLFAPLIARSMGIAPDEVDLFNRFAPSSLAHPLGTDELGRDLLIRLLDGSRISLFIGLSSAFAAALIGTVVGLCSGYVGGRLDAFLMRLTDAIIALPLLPLLIILAALDFSKLGLPAGLMRSGSGSLYVIIAIVALFGWTTVARLVRGATLSVREHDYVRAARALGAGPGRIVLAHILPNVASPMIVATTLSVGNVILIESTLSFLGLGIQPPLASWGSMLTNAQELIWQAPALAIYPGLLIFSTVIAFNFLGDGLQDALDPRAKDR